MSMKRSPTRRRAATFSLALGLILAQGSATAQNPDGVTAADDSGRSFWSAVVHTVGGAVVGGWLGWMGSQVSMSDWDKSSNGELMRQRAGWVAGGAVAGVVVSQLIGRTSPPGAALPTLQPYRGGRRSVITRASIQASGVTNAYELISGLRPEWLRAERGVNQWSESARGSGSGMGSAARVDITPGEPTIVVYLNTSRLGGLDALRDVPIYDLQQAEFIGPQEAVTRYGTGHAHGVIRLSTELSPPASTGAVAAEPGSGSIHTAARDVFLERGFDGASLDLIAARASVSVDRVRAQYRNKTEAFDAVVPGILPVRLETGLRDLIGPLPPAAGDVVAHDRNAATRLAELLAAYRHETVILLTRAGGSRYDGLMKDLTWRSVDVALQRFRPDGGVSEQARLATERATRDFLEGLVGIVDSTGDQNLTEAVGLHARYYLAGLAALLD